MRTLITGATGFIGRKVTEKLIRHGHEVVVVSRDKNKAKRTLHWPVEIVEGDLSKGVLDTSLFAGVEAVVNLAGENIGEGRWSEEEKERIKKSRVRLSSNLLASLEKTALKVWVQGSAIGYYRDGEGDEWLDEGSESGHNFLAEVCREWEEPAIKLGQESPKTRIVIARIGVVLGHDGALMKETLPLFRLGLGGKAGSGRQWMSWVHADDACAFLAAAAQNEKYKGVYNLVAPAPARNADFTGILAGHCHRPAWAPAPKFLLKLLMGEKSYLALSSQRIRSKLEQEGFKFKYPDLDSAMKEICADEALPRHSKNRFHFQVRKSYVVDGSPTDVFDFFSRPENLTKVADSNLGVELLSSSDKKLKQGSRFVFKMKKNGLPVRIESEVVELNSPRGFTDVQVKGPFHCWHHVHSLEKLPSENGADKTVVVDHVKYSLPAGVAGDLAAIMNVNKEVEEMFDKRVSAIVDLFKHGDI